MLSPPPPQRLQRPLHCLLSVRSSPSEAPPALGMAFSLFLSSSLAKKDGEVGDAQGDSYGCPCLCSPALHGEAWPELLMAEGDEPASSESAALSLSSLDEEVGEPRPPPSCNSDGRRASGSSKRRLYVQQRVCMVHWTSVSQGGTAAQMRKLRSLRQRAMSGIACPLRRVSGGPRSSKRRQ